MTQLLKTAAFSVDFDPDSRKMEASGALALMVQPILKTMNQRLSEEKPAQVRIKDIVATTWLPPIPSGPFKRLLINEARIAIGRPVPQTVSIEVTRQCGARCEHCLIKEGVGELSHEEILRVIDEALDMGASIITFTEEIHFADIFELIRYINPRRPWSISSPRTRDDHRKGSELKEAGLYNLIIGIYSPDPAEHDLIRGVEGAHAKAVEAIKVALEAGLMVTMSCHVKAGQVEKIPELYQFAVDLGVQELSIWEGIPKTPDERLTQLEREKIIDIYRKVNSTPGGPRIFASTYFEGQMLGCMAGRRWLHVGVDGGVRGCPYLEKSYGNILESPLKNIWADMRRSGEFEGFTCSCPAQNIYI
jgi:MoaA/NifB/PqqE/SkfB family radical SAM enzyme